jgi:hypothetical protein
MLRRRDDDRPETFGLLLGLSLRDGWHRRTGSEQGQQADWPGAATQPDFEGDVPASVQAVDIGSHDDVPFPVRFARDE